jgi:glycosyltransferase involved in cell wall biosynthesis
MSSGSAVEDRPSISVILPTFNRAGYIAKAIESVLSQSVAIHQFVVVDDGSTDGTSEVVSRYRPLVDYVRQPNAGKLVAIRRGLEITDGDLVWIMDDDDIAPANALEALVAPLATDPSVAYSYGRRRQRQTLAGRWTLSMTSWPAGGAFGFSTSSTR